MDRFRLTCPTHSGCDTQYINIEPKNPIFMCSDCAMDHQANGIKINDIIRPDFQIYRKWPINNDAIMNKITEMLTPIDYKIEYVNQAYDKISKEIEMIMQHQKQQALQKIHEISDLQDTFKEEYMKRSKKFELKQIISGTNYKNIEAQAAKALQLITEVNSQQEVNQNYFENIIELYEEKLECLNKLEPQLYQKIIDIFEPKCQIFKSLQDQMSNLQSQILNSQTSQSEQRTQLAVISSLQNQLKRKGCGKKPFQLKCHCKDRWELNETKYTCTDTTSSLTFEDSQSNENYSYHMDLQKEGKENSYVYNYSIKNQRGYAYQDHQYLTCGSECHECQFQNRKPAIAYCQQCAPQRFNSMNQ